MLKYQMFTMKDYNVPMLKYQMFTTADYDAPMLKYQIFTMKDYDVPMLKYQIFTTTDYNAPMLNSQSQFRIHPYARISTYFGKPKPFLSGHISIYRNMAYRSFIFFSCVFCKIRVNFM